MTTISLLPGYLLPLMFNLWGENMAAYSMERREAVVRRILTGERSIPALAKDASIAEWALYRRRNEAMNHGEAVRNVMKHNKIPAARKLTALVESAALNEAELAEYCRKQGFPIEEVKRCR